jgi:ArsR family transcriptional regulator
MDTIAVAVDLLHLFGDSTRLRLASLLGKNELTVAEITQITQLPQSRVSTHLGKLREAGVLRDRREGAQAYYVMNDDGMPASAHRLWALLGRELSEPLLRSDQERCQAVLRARRGVANWPETVAGQMERHYSPGRTWETTAIGVLGLLHLGDVLDAGSGDGTIAALLAPRSRRVTCLDISPKVLQACHRRLQGLANVEFVLGDVQTLRFADASFDQVLLLNLLTYATEPAQALAEAARVLRPGGDLVVTTLAAHEHRDVTAGYGHVHAGFRPQALRDWLTQAGLVVDRCEVTSREKRAPHFAVVSAFARKAASRTGEPRPTAKAGLPAEKERHA